MNFINYNIIKKEKDLPGGLLSYCMTANGIVKIDNNGIFKSTQLVTDSIPDLYEVELKPAEFVAPKIPLIILCQLHAFFRAVYTRDNTESTAFVMLDNNTKEYSIYIPKQYNSTAASDYRRYKDEGYKTLLTTHTLIMIAHSHPWKTGTPPMPSPTDNGDEFEGILYAVFGNAAGYPQITFSTVIYGKRIFLNESDIFDDKYKEAKKEILRHIPKAYRSMIVYSRADYIRTFIDENIESFSVPEGWLSNCISGTNPENKMRVISYGDNRQLTMEKVLPNIFEHKVTTDVVEHIVELFATLNKQEVKRLNKLMGGYRIGETK